MSSIASAQPAAQEQTSTWAITPEQKDLVHSSFMRLEPAADFFVTLFYRRLFEIAPEVKPLFTGDFADQQRKLASMFTMAFTSLARLEDMVPTLKLLGVKHRSYGVKAQHYGMVGEALLWSLEQSFGDDFTPELRDAWTAVYTALAEIMHGAEMSS
jgi:nitric oxide dioxygenase